MSKRRALSKATLAAALLALAGLAAQPWGAGARAGGQTAAASPAAPVLPVAPALVVRRLPHDSTAFTEGLFIDGGELFESTGMEGRSFIRRSDLESGRVLARTRLPAHLFGEGIALWQGTIFSLTWRDGMGFRWTRDRLRPQGRFAYMGEGWALTSDGRQLIMSDGTATLRFVEPVQFRTTRLLPVTAQGQPVANLNELEYVDGEILANVWMTDRIARIDPENGHVIGWIDVAALRREVRRFGPDQVANGIAWDAAKRRLYVTGKEWPVLFEIVPPKGR